MNIPTPFPEDGKHVRIEVFKGEARERAHQDDRPKPVAFKTLAAFVKEYSPLDHTIEPIVRGGSLYTLTAKTGAGKTALMVVMALAVATGCRDILNLDVITGRVAYLTAENPDDARMRFMIACYLLNIDFAAIADRIVILDRREKPEDICASLAKLAEEEPFALVLVDTLAAFFDGKDINSAVEGGEFLRRLRPLTRITGLPTVVVAAHPVKNADQNNLVPYGSGAILNEVDGNLTLWKEPETGLVSLHHQGKLRGLEFEPMLFRLEITGPPDVLDAKGRQVQLPTLRPSSAEAAEEREKISVNRDVALLKAMRDNPGGSIRAWATAAGIHRSSAERTLNRLATPKEGKLVEKTLGKWMLTPAGIKAQGLGLVPGRAPKTTHRETPGIAVSPRRDSTPFLSRPSRRDGNRDETPEKPSKTGRLTRDVTRDEPPVVSLSRLSPL